MIPDKIEEPGKNKALAFTLLVHAGLIAALFLFQFGTGPIRGFAVTLSIGILGTLFCAIFVSRFLFDLVYTPSRKSQSISI